MNLSENQKRAVRDLNSEICRKCNIQLMNRLNKSTFRYNHLIKTIAVTLIVRFKN